MLSWVCATGSTQSVMLLLLLLLLLSCGAVCLSVAVVAHISRTGVVRCERVLHLVCASDTAFGAVFGTHAYCPVPCCLLSRPAESSSCSTVVLQ